MKRKLPLVLLICIIAILLVLPVSVYAATVDGCDIGTYTLYDTFTATDGLEGTWTQNHPNSSEAYGKLVDGNTATKWCTISQNSFNTIWIEFNASEAFIPKGYLLTTGGDTSSSEGRNPKNWTIEAKLNENDSWTTIASVTEDTVLQAKDTTTYKFPLESNTAAYKYFRFEITAIQGKSGEVDWTMQLAELRFYGDNSVAYYAAKAATCTETGNVEYYYRLSDGKYFSDSGCTSELAEGEVFIAALGHDCVEGETVAPTCTDEGYTVFSCTRCDHTEHRNTVSSLGHTWGEWGVTTPATCTAEGKSTRTCSVCGAQENEAIPVIDHTWGDWSVTTPATCTAAGEKTRACSECGAQESEATAALGHVFDNGVCTRCGITPTEISDWAALKAAFAAGGSYKLVADVSGELSDGYLNVPAGISVWLDLNGHSAGRDLQYGYNLGFVIKVAGTLTVSDGVGGGTITGGNNYHTFMNNDSEDCAGGVTVKEGGVFTLYGGSITGNKAYSGANGRAYGGGVYVDGGATFVMNGGSITGNMATCSGNIPYGGGVCVDEGATFEMNGGSITGNRLISNNKLYYGRGAGVYVKGTFNVSGLVTVSGNLMSKDSGGSFDNQDVYLESDCLINVVGPLDPSSLITYYSSSFPTNDPKIITNGLDGNGTYRNFATSISQYSSGYADIYLSGTEAALCQAFQMTIGSHEHGEIAIGGGLIRVSGETITVTVTPDDGYYVSGVTYTDAYEPYPAAPTGTPGVFTFTMPYYNSTVSATMAETPAATVAGGIENGAVSLSVGGTPIASGSRVLPGTVVTVTATGDDGYGVSSVTVGGEPITAVMGTYSFTMPTTDVTVSATFSTLYKVDINGSRNFTLIPDKEYAVAGETVTITAECRYGYTVDHIYDMSHNSEDIYPENDVFTFTMPSDNVKMNAILRSPKVTFNYSSYNGIADVVGGEYNPAEGDTVTVRLTPDDGYLSWSIRVYYLDQYDNQIDIDSVFDRTTGIGTFTMPAGEVIVEVFFLEYRSVTIDNISGGTAVISVGGNVVQSGARVAPGETVTVTFNAASGHNFVDKFISIYWYDENDDKYECYWSKNDNVYTFTMPEYYVYIDAVFPSDNIHIEITGEGTATASRYYAEKDEEVSVYVEPADGYYLKRIGDNNGNLQFEFRNDRYYFSMGEDAVTICVTFAPLPTVTVPDMEHGSAVIKVYGNTVASGSRVPVGTSVFVTYTANEGYYINCNGVDIYTLDENDQKHEVDFYPDDTDTDHLTLVCRFDMPEDDVVVRANFDSDNVQIVIVGEGTAIADRYYTVQDDIHLSISPAEGYILKGVTVEADEGRFDYEDSCVKFSKEQYGEVRITVTFVSPTIDGHRMQLESEIGVGFKVNFNGGYGYDDSLRYDCYVTFSVSDGRKGRMDGSEASEEDGYFWFTGYVNALELADDITATLHSHDGSVLATNTYSAMEYIEYVKENMSENKELTDLVESLQNYGHYMQQSGWTDGKVHEPIAAATTLDADDITETASAVSGYKFTSDIGTSGIEDVRFSLTLNAKTVINVFVRLADGVTTSGYSGTTTIGDKTYYVFKSAEIDASQLGNAKNINVTTSEGEATFTVAALAYARAALNNGSQTEAKKLAMAAFNDYFEKVDAYAETH